MLTEHLWLPFHRRIGYDISCTCTKLEKLTECKSFDQRSAKGYRELLITFRCSECVHSLVPILPVARGRSLFGDPTSEIQELTQVIKQDLAKLNTDIADLQQQVKARSHRETRNMKTHSSSVVVSLQVGGY